MQNTNGCTDPQRLLQYSNTELLKKKSMSIFTWDGIQDTLMSSYDSLKYYKMLNDFV